MSILEYTVLLLIDICLIQVSGFRIIISSLGRLVCRSSVGLVGRVKGG